MPSPPTPSLSDAQTQLLASIRALDSQVDSAANTTPTSRGLQAYRANARLSAVAALAAVYPVSLRLLGADSFDALARHFWQVQPPVRGDWAQWGEALAPFVAQQPLLADMPYLPDVARLEWALHQCAGAADAAVDLPSLALLTTQDPAQLQLRLSNACLLRSNYPVASICLAHQAADPLPQDLAHLGQLLAQQTAQTALVWRAGFAPRLRALGAREYLFVTALLAGACLGQALDVAVDMDFSAWLHAGVAQGLVIGALEIP